ncbi:MAG TPA: DNA replication and repair protein RecF [Gemmatimonadales bacterium]|nr:DNA replication and repair protein RecF [Gemmatimonadales bacterium]
MRLERLVARGFRNLADLDLPIPAAGVALLGANGQGKTNFLEAVYYPVLFRSLRNAADRELAQFGGSGFHVTAQVEARNGRRTVAATWTPELRRKRLALDGVDVPRVSDAVGAWLAVAFQPGDVALASGGAGERRQYLDRMLSLASRDYLRSLARYRAAVAQRNSALRLGRLDLARAFDGPMAEAGAHVISARMAWVEGPGARFGSELRGLGEPLEGALRYRGKPELANADAWIALLDATAQRDLGRRMTTVGPHRDDLVAEIGGRELRAFGSTGQQRTAALALKLLELDTLAAAREDEPALLLDDAFAELDRGRQERLAARLFSGTRQVFVTAPRMDELPPGMEVEVWGVGAGVVGGGEVGS